MPGKTSSKGSSSEEVNKVHFSKYCRDTIVDNIEVIHEVINDDEMEEPDKEFIEHVYSCGNSDIDPYKLVVDCGCPKTVAGRPWMDAFIESKGNVKIRLEKERERFRFGPSQVFTSTQNYEIEVHVGDLTETIKVSVVDADVPLLLGLDYQSKWGMVIDVGRNIIRIRKSNQTFKMNPDSSHWKLPIQRGTLHGQAKNLVMHVNLLELDAPKLRKHIKKVHKKTRVTKLKSSY